MKNFVDSSCSLSNILFPQIIDPLTKTNNKRSDQINLFLDIKLFSIIVYSKRGYTSTLSVCEPLSLNEHR